MLNFTITPHREFLPAETPGQKLFMMLKLQPTQEIAQTQPSTTFVFLIDTSGSMYEVVAGETGLTGKQVQVDGHQYNEVIGGQTKIDLVIESLKSLIHSGRLNREDYIAIIQFDDDASSLIDLTPATEIDRLIKAIDQLREFSGGTCLGIGMQHTLKLLSHQSMKSCRTLIFTDGQTVDEEQCRELAQQFALQNIPITALGVGDYAEDILIDLSDTTGGRLFHVTPDETFGTAVSIQELPDRIIQEFTKAQQDVITNLALTIKTVKEVKLTRIIRAYPEQAEFPLTKEPYPLGNATANDETIFLLEFSLNGRPESRVRLAQLSLTYNIPGQKRRGEIAPQDIVVKFVAGQMGAQINSEVMGYLQQCNIAQLVKQATQVADRDPQQAEQILENVRRMTQRLGNERMTHTIVEAQEELRKTRQISPVTRKTVKMGAKGKTVHLQDDEIQQQLSDDLIRQVSGT